MSTKTNVTLPRYDTNTYPRGTMLGETLFFQKFGYLYTSHPENPDPMSVYVSAKDSIVVDCVECGKPKSTRVASWARKEQIRCKSCVCRAVNHSRPFLPLDEGENWELIKPFYVDERDPHTIAAQGHERIAIRCPLCGGVRQIEAHTVSDLHLLCRPCSYEAGNPVRPNESIMVIDPNRVARAWDFETNKARGLNVFGLRAGSGMVASIICSECGEHFDQRVGDFMRSDPEPRCPHCRSSKAEKLVDAVLAKYDLYGDPEVSFSGLKSTNGISLHVDRMVALSETAANNRQYIAGVEYQGPHHTNPNYYFFNHSGATTSFEDVQENDARKATYLAEHGYPLLTIPYTNYSVESIDRCFREFCLESNLEWLLLREND